MKIHGTIAVAALLVALFGCDDPANPPGIPRPSDASLINWLNQERITLEKGIFVDSGWTIEKGEVSEFRVLQVTSNPSDRVYTARVSFRATASGHGIQVSEGLIRYKEDSPGSDKLRFVDFVPVSVSRFGN